MIDWRKENYIGILAFLLMFALDYVFTHYPERSKAETFFSILWKFAIVFILQTSYLH